ncbi:MAG: PEGA domain-containing protein [Lentimicrobiaceae bacterium]|nr:PEGA domain-containing protein [Lentimicrobiaceae bacterium]
MINVMKRFFLILLILVSLDVAAQNDYFKIKEGSFTHVVGAVMDDAKEHTDVDNKPMALFKISTENINDEERHKLYFTGNRVTEISDKVYKTGSVWIYVTAEHSDFLEIRHPDYGVTRFYFPESLCDFCTYEMVLQYIDPTPAVETGFLAVSTEPNEADVYVDGKSYGKTTAFITDLAEGSHTLKLEKQGYVTLTKSINIVKGETLKLNETLQTVSSQKTFLIVKADQPDARIYIDDNLKNTGEHAESVIIGTTHTYKIECNLYHTETGTVTVNDKMTVNKTLRPAFGYINISTSPEQGAKVFVDGDYIGISPVKTDKLKSGSYTVMVMKDMYKMKEQSFTVTDGQTTNANLTMSANFVTLTINTDADSDIYVDEDYKGRGRWTGRVSEGLHNLEARKQNHRSSRTSVDLILGENKTITIEAPKPISGSIEINSSPMEANIYIDGKSYGTTPNYINEILIGTHTLKLEKNGCAPITKTITIKENETLTVNEKLQTGKEIVIKTDKSGDKVYVDNNYVGLSPITTTVVFGSHNIKAERDGKTVSKAINVSQYGGDNSVMLTFSSNETFTVNGVSFTMIKVEGGTFSMGATSEQGSDADSDEKPVHSVTLSDYYIGETEVTQELWEAVMGTNPSYFRGSQKPVENVSWNDCKEFITKLNNLTGMNFRLPTEAEWEYASRGGNKSKGYKYSGSNTIGNVAWYWDNSGSTTHNVKTKSPNELGIYDMSGNVWEWCEDWYGSYSSGSQTNPTGPSSGSNRVDRGGGWINNAEYCRVSNRSSFSPSDRSGNLGFRVVCLP